MKKIIFAIAALLLSMSAANAQDWANFSRFHEANQTVTTKPTAVLLGDSITEGWPNQDPAFFTDNNFLGRGISGQCSTQILVRMREDVIKLSPKYVVILCGINDIAMNAGTAEKPEYIFGNIVSMVELAKANKIKPVLCTTTPAKDIPWRTDINNVVEPVQELNAMIRAYAKKNHILLVEYYDVMVGEDGCFPSDLAYDGIHPTLAGYKVMEECLLKVLK